MQEMLQMVRSKLNVQEEAIHTSQKNDKHRRKLYSQLQKDIEAPRIKIIPKRKNSKAIHIRDILYIHKHQNIKGNR
jgi:hypothetical protein